MDCRPLANLYELYLLGALPDADAAQIRSHLRGQCPVCAGAVHDAALTILALLESLPPAASTPQQRAHCMARLKGRQSKR